MKKIRRSTDFSKGDLRNVELFSTDFQKSELATLIVGEKENGLVSQRKIRKSLPPFCTSRAELRPLEAPLYRVIT